MAKTLALSHLFYTQLNGLVNIFKWSFYFGKKGKGNNNQNKIKIQYNLLIKNQKHSVTTFIIILFQIKISTIFYHHQKIAKNKKKEFKFYKKLSTFIKDKLGKNKINSN